MELECKEAVNKKLRQYQILMSILVNNNTLSLPVCLSLFLLTLNKGMCLVGEVD